MNIGIVGAGLAGLSCAFRLHQAGHRVTVYERESVPGGRMSTAHAGAFSFDTGANLLLDHYERLRALAADAGIAHEWFAFQSGSGGILEDGDLSPAPESFAALLRHPGLSTASRLHLVAFALRAWRRRDDLDFFDLGVGDDELDAVDAWTGAVERLGEDVATRLVDPFVRTFHFHSARLLSMKYFEALVSLLLRGRFTTHGFRGYMEALPRALAAQLPVRTGVAVTRVHPASEGVTVAWEGGEARHDAVVLATTASVSRRLLVEPTPAQTLLLGEIRYSSTLMCSYRVPLHAAGDFEGIWVPFDESTLICDCANEACKGSRDAHACVLTMGLHDEAARELAELSDAHVLALVATEWERLSPRCGGELTALHVQRWPEALPVYGVGNVARVRAFWERGQGEGGVWLAGDYLNHPWLEGAVRCGEKVAARVSG
jgi:oxygen-dependent protoporphyrinogen oxidase